MSQSARDQEADDAVRSAVLRLFGEDAIERIEVIPTEDHAGEDTLSVTIFLKTSHEQISGVRLLDTIAAVAEALRDIDDSRFPYVTFLAPGYEHSEDTRRAP